MSQTIRINHTQILDHSDGKAIIHAEIDGGTLRLRTYDATNRERVLDAGFGVSTSDFNQVYVDAHGKLKLI